MKAQLFAVLVLGFAAIFLVPNASAQQATSIPGQGQIQGQIKAARVVGLVTVARAGAAVLVTLSNNDPVLQGDVVVTGKGSSVVLVFSNGSTVSVGPDSRLAVDEFTQDPFAQDVKLTDLKQEPTTSHTKLNLTYGELVGNVKKLKGDSTFQVQTPVGAAGIRGTTFQLTYIPGANGAYTLMLGTASGLVIFQGRGTPVSVPANVQLNVSVTFNDATGQMEPARVTTTGLSDAVAQAIQDAVAQAVAALGETTFEALLEQQMTLPPSNPPTTTPEDGQL
jgi:ferric-dicitrate binding protein FerR (iron transport regulator)